MTDVAVASYRVCKSLAILRSRWCFTKHGRKRVKSYPNNIGYDVYFKSVLDISHNWTGSGRCSRSRGWIGRHSHNKVEWIGGGIATGVHIPNFSLFQLATVKPFCRGPISVTSKPFQPTISGRIFNVKPKIEPSRIQRKIKMDMVNFFNLCSSFLASARALYNSALKKDRYQVLICGISNI